MDGPGGSEGASGEQQTLNEDKKTHRPEGPAAAISRLGLVAVAYNCDCCTSPCFWDGNDSRLNGDAESQVRHKHLSTYPVHRALADAGT